MRARWSHSRLVKLLRCGEAYRREEEEQEFSPPSSSMVRGTVVHAVAAEGHERQIKGKASRPGDPKPMVLRESLPDEEEAADLAASRFDWERKQSGIVGVRDPEVDEPEKVVIGRDKDSAVRMSRHLVTKVAPYVDPISVEEKLVVEPADANIRISGILDLVTNEPPLVPGGPPRRGVRDYKSKRKAPDAGEAAGSGQLSMYALLDSLVTGRIADVFALDFIVDDGRFLKPPYFVSQESTRTQEDIDVMIERLNNAIEGAAAGVFLANGVGTWQCSPRWCQWWTTCKFVSKARVKT